MNNKFTKIFVFLSVGKKGHKVNYLESLEINKLKYSGLLHNDQMDTNNSPHFNLFNHRQSKNSSTVNYFLNSTPFM